MKFEKEVETKIYATFTKDEWMAIIAAIHMSTKEGLIQHYSSYLDFDMIEKLNLAQIALAGSFQTDYGYECSSGILKYIEGEY